MNRIMQIRRNGIGVAADGSQGVEKLRRLQLGYSFHHPGIPISHQLIDLIAFFIGLFRQINAFDPLIHLVRGDRVALFLSG